MVFENLKAVISLYVACLRESLGARGDWPVGPFGRLHEVKKTLNTEYGELCSVYMKESALKLWIYHKSEVFLTSLPNDLRLLESTGQFSQTVLPHRII